MGNGPFKLKGWSPFTKTSPAKDDPHTTTEDHATHETEETEDDEMKKLKRRYYYAETSGFTSPEEGGLQPLSDEETKLVEAHIASQ